jgi:hypothetical protein
MTDHGEILATIEPGDVVLIGNADPFWTGCLVRVEVVKSWGIRGSVFGPQGAEYPLRIGFENITTVFRERR